MFEQINLLFTAGTIENDRDALVLQTICNLIEQNQKDWKGFTLTEVTNYCLGVSLDQIYAALPLTMNADGTTKPALTIVQTVQSISRLQTWCYLKNDDEFEVIHLHRDLLAELNRVMDAEIKRIEARCDEIGQNVTLMEAENILMAAQQQA